MQKSQIELLALIAAIVASALALMLPVQYAWVTSIGGFVLLAGLFSYDEAGYRSAFQSVAFSGACGLGVMLLSVVYYRWLAGKGEIHMAGGRIETDWLPLTWLCSTAAICAIDRIRMLGYKDATKRSAGAVQRGFIPQYAEVEEPKTAASRATVLPEMARVAASAKPSPIATAAAPVNEPVAAPTPIATAAVPMNEPVAAAQPFAAPVSAPTPAPIPPAAGKQVEIYVALIGEGLNLMRTVKAEHVGRDFYKIIEAMPEGETWEFTPGQVVRCKKRNLSTGKGLVAVEEAPRAS
jgi:hypothetical protein